MNWINDAKAGWTAAVGLLGTAASSAMQWLPAAVTVVSGLLGICLSIVLIRAQWANGSKSRLELKMLKEKDARQKREASKRITSGEPLRRASDKDQQ